MGKRRKVKLYQDYNDTDDEPKNKFRQPDVVILNLTNDHTNFLKGLCLHFVSNPTCERTFAYILQFCKPTQVLENYVQMTKGEITDILSEGHWKVMSLFQHFKVKCPKNVTIQAFFLEHRTSFETNFLFPKTELDKLNSWWKVNLSERL